MLSFSGDRGAEVVGASSSASRGLDDLLGAGGACFGGRVISICPSDLHLGGANSSDAGTPFKKKNMINAMILILIV